MIKSAFKVIFFVSLSLFSLYATFVSDDRTFGWPALFLWGGVFYYWWQEDREKAKAREEKRIELLNDCVAYLERELQQRQR
jgi:hypothetical protein